MTRDLQPFVYRYFAHLNLIPCWFHRLLSDALIQFVQDVENRLSPRLIIEAPPRHSKSMFTTRGFVPWVLAKHPSWDMIVANSTQRLADYFGRDIQRVTGDPEYQAAFPAAIPSKESNAVNYAMNASRGQYMLIGAGGKLPGFGGKILVCVAGTTEVTTPAGTQRMSSLREGDLVLTPSGPRRILRHVCNGEKECIAVGVGGRTLILTPDHHVYTETGWREAGSLRPGDKAYVENLQALRETIHAERPLPREDTRTSPLLLAAMSQRGEEGSAALSGVRNAVREVYRAAHSGAVLLSRMLFHRRTSYREDAHPHIENLPGVREGTPTKNKQSKVLFEALCERRPLQAHGADGKPKLSDREVDKSLPDEVHPENIPDPASRDREMHGVWSDRETTYSPQERTKERRPTGELDSPMHILSPEEARCRLEDIESVRNVGAHQVFDATVEGDRCFFADGVLTHNCDDIVAGREMAESETQMEALWDWFNGDFMNRVAPGGGVIIMATRWALKDITGRVLAADTKGKWKRLSFPALAEHDEPHRKAGEPLQPEWYTKEMLEEERDRLIASGKERDWISLFQQRPANASGNFFKSQHFIWRDVEKIPAPDAEDTHWYLGVDFAASVKATADCRALVPIGVNNDGFYYFAPDILNGRYSPNEFVKLIVDKIEKYRPLKLFCEKGPLDAVYGPLLKDEMARRKVYCTIEAVKSGEKWVVAAPMQARMEASKVIFPDNQTYRLVVAPQFLNFVPGADGEDDIIDAAAKVFSALDKLRAPAPKPQAEKPDPIKEDKDHWAQIDKYARGTTSEQAPRRLNGTKY